MLGSIAEGVTRVSGFLEGEDALATDERIPRARRAHRRTERGNVTVHGVGLRGLKASSTVLDCGNSGTSMRLLSGLLAGQNFDCELTGDASLRRRPMQRVAAPLGQMRAEIKTAEGGRPPLRSWVFPTCVESTIECPLRVRRSNPHCAGGAFTRAAGPV